MKPHIIGKLGATLILGIVLTLWMQHSLERQRSMTREAYLAKAAARYDRQIKRPIPTSFLVIFCISLSGITLGTYELIGFSLTKISKIAISDLAKSA
jgi:hypothetical protein